MIQLEYFLGLVSMNFEAFLGFAFVLHLLWFKCGQFNKLLCILDSEVGRVLASHTLVSKFESFGSTKFIYS